MNAPLAKSEVVEVTAKHRGARISAQKVRLVADLIRGKSYEESRQLLAFSTRKAAKLVSKVLESAVANAENNNGLDVDELYVSTIFVDEAITMKRIKTRAKGRADRILKRGCHITVKVAERG